MKIIDKNGRLFGFINIIDLLVLIAVIGIIIVGVKRFGNKTTTAGAQTKPGIVVAEIAEVRDATVNAVKVGDPLYDYDKGTYIGEIAEVSSEPFTKEVEYQGKWVKAEVPEKYVVNLKLKVDVKETDDFYQIGTEQLRVGAQQRVKNKKFASFITVLDIEV